jgi:hypothetical protein
MGYKLRVDPRRGARRMSMIYRATPSRDQQRRAGQDNGDGVDVFIHRDGRTAAVLAYKNMGLNAPPSRATRFFFTIPLAAVTNLTTVQTVRHTPQGAFGYPPQPDRAMPKLTVATHFPVARRHGRVRLRERHQSRHPRASGWAKTSSGPSIRWCCAFFPDGRIEHAPHGRLGLQLSTLRSSSTAPTYPPKYNDSSGAGESLPNDRHLGTNTPRPILTAQSTTASTGT